MISAGELKTKKKIKGGLDMTVAIEARTDLVTLITKPKFRNPDDMTIEELTDPDYAKKQIMRLFGNGKDVDLLTCSKCHHCR